MQWACMKEKAAKQFALLAKLDRRGIGKIESSTVCAQYRGNKIDNY